MVLPEELSIADGTLTPSMKLRRRHLEQRYHKQIDALYAEEQAARPRRAARRAHQKVAATRIPSPGWTGYSLDGLNRNCGFAM